MMCFIKNTITNNTTYYHPSFLPKYLLSGRIAAEHMVQRQSVAAKVMVP